LPEKYKISCFSDSEATIGNGKKTHYGDYRNKKNKIDKGDFMANRKADYIDCKNIKKGREK
jgi:hypothetical protein